MEIIIRIREVYLSTVSMGGNNGLYKEIALVSVHVYYGITRTQTYNTRSRDDENNEITFY